MKKMLVMYAVFPWDRITIKFVTIEGRQNCNNPKCCDMFVCTPDLQYLRQLLILWHRVILYTDPTTSKTKLFIVRECSLLLFWVISISDRSGIPLIGTHIQEKANSVFCKISHLKAHTIKEIRSVEVSCTRGVSPCLLFPQSATQH